MRSVRTIATAFCLLAVAACADRPDASADPEAQRAADPAAPAAEDPASYTDGTRGGTARVPVGEDAATADGGPLLGMSAGPQVHLLDGAGMAVYMLEGNTDGSKCDAMCEEAWPPVLATVSRAEAGTGLDPQLLGMNPRRDQSYQVSYGNNPLYRYAGDMGAGRTNGHGVRDRWGTWSLVGLDGKPVGDPLPQADRSNTGTTDSGAAQGNRQVPR